MGFLEVLKKNKDIRRLFGERELKIIEKQLLGISATHEYLPASGQIAIKYKKDNETSFSTLTTNTTDGTIRTTAINDANKSTLPKFKEITFRIESTGGAVPTGLRFKVKDIDDDGY